MCHRFVKKTGRVDNPVRSAYFPAYFMRYKRIYALLFPVFFLSVENFSSAQPAEQPVVATEDSAALRARMEQADRIWEEYPDSAGNIYMDLYRKSLAIGFREGMITCLFQLGNIATNREQYEQALLRFSLALGYCDPAADRQRLVGIYNNIGNVYNRLGRFEQAYRAYEKALRYAADFPAELVTIYNNLANVLGQLNRMDKAIAYIDKAIPVAAESRNYKLLSGLLINKGRCYYELRDYGQAQRCIRDAAAIARRQQLYREYSVALLNLAMIHIVTGSPAAALPQLQEAVRPQGGVAPDDHTRYEILSAFGDVYLSLKRYTEAENYLQQAWHNSAARAQQRLTLTGQLAKLYVSTGRYEQAYAYQLSYIGLRDSLYNKETAAKVNELETKYRTAEKDRELMRNSFRISEQQQRLAQQRNRILLIAGAALASILLLLWRQQFLRARYRRLKDGQEIAYLKAFMEGEQQERIRIATELHDGIVGELAAVRMRLDAAADQAAPAARQADYRDTLGQLDRAINDVRNTAHNLMPEILLRYSLPQAVALLCATIRKTGRLETDFQEYGDFTQLSMQMRQSAYRIVQELIHNIIRHARATRALVQLSCYNGLLTITVEDNGVGMDKNTAGTHAGMGMMSIERRVRSGNGTIEWSRPETGSGMSVHVAFEV